MQTPHNGSGITVDSWTEGGDTYCAAEPRQSTESASLSRYPFLLIFLGVVTMAAALGAWSQATIQRYSTRIGQLGHVELPDGSMAILNTATEIELAFTRKVRRVKLIRGEALFDVAADPYRVFVAEADGFRVETYGSSSTSPRKDGAHVGWLVDYARDVATPLTRRTSHTLFATRGTTFTLRRKPRDTIELVVLEGSTEVRHREPSELNPARISEDTVAGAIGHRLLEATRISTFELSARVGWLDRRVAPGPGTTIREAAQEFNRYNEVQLLVVGSMGERQVRGDFDVDQPHTFAVTIARMSDAELHVSDKLITIREPEQPTRQ